MYIQYTYLYYYLYNKIHNEDYLCSINQLIMLTEYLLTHHKQELVQILKHEDVNKHFSININFLELFEDDTSIGNNVVKEPDGTLAKCNESAVKAQLVLINELEEKDLMTKNNVQVRIYSLLSCPELNRVVFPKSQDLGLFLQISGTVVRTTTMKVLEYQRSYKCTKCKHVIMVQADFEQRYVITAPKRCNNPEKCEGTNLVTLGNLNSSNCKDYQELKIQEQVSKLGFGTIPNVMWVILEDDLVEICKPGDDVTICGIVKRRWKMPSPGKKLEAELVIKANHVQVNNDASSIATVTQETKQQFITFWEENKTCPLLGRDLILRSFCPQIYGLYLVKLAVMVVLAGGSQSQSRNDTGVRSRAEAHLLLVGDPGTGKSQLLKFASKVIPRSVLTTGVGSTSAGLTATAIMENGEWQLEGGALVLSDGGLCCIDEFNSMKEHDRTSIHEAMEQQTISVAKASIVCKLNTRCSILAATNPKGHLDSSQPLTVNIALASPLLSRFDLVLILKDNINNEWDNLVADYILSGHKNMTEENNQVTWSLDILQAYISVIKKIHPILTDYSNKILSSYYQLQRRSTYRNKARTTVRLLDSLVRLSQGHARLMFHSQVEVMDAIIAVVLSEASMQGDSGVLSLEFDIHSAYPSDPMESYYQVARTVLEKLGLLNILEEEKEAKLQNIKIESVKTEVTQPSTNVDKTCSQNSIDDEVHVHKSQNNMDNDEFILNENALFPSMVKAGNSTKRKRSLLTEVNKPNKSVTKKSTPTDLELLNAIPSVNDSFNMDFNFEEENTNGDEESCATQNAKSLETLSLTGKLKPFINQFRFKPTKKFAFNHTQNKCENLMSSRGIKTNRSSQSIFENPSDFDSLDLDI